MRTLCDACESAAAIVFCAADEAAFCRACDEKVFFFFTYFVSIIVESIFSEIFFAVLFLIMCWCFV